VSPRRGAARSGLPARRRAPARARARVPLTFPSLARCCSRARAPLPLSSGLDSRCVCFVCVARVWAACGCAVVRGVATAIPASVCLYPVLYACARTPRCARRGGLTILRGAGARNAHRGQPRRLQPGPARVERRAREHMSVARPRMHMRAGGPDNPACVLSEHGDGDSARHARTPQTGLHIFKVYSLQRCAGARASNARGRRNARATVPVPVTRCLSPAGLDLTRRVFVAPVSLGPGPGPTGCRSARTVTKAQAGLGSPAAAAGSLALRS
jgi:hypothetical protein